MSLKSRKLFKYVFFSLTITIAVVAYNIYKINENDMIRSKIEKEVQQDEYVDFGKAVNGDWDNIILVTPYTDKTELKNNYGISVNRISDFSIAYRDDRVLILFCKGESIQNYVYWFGSVSLSETEKMYGSLQINREDSKFNIDKSSSNTGPINLIIVKE